MKEYLTCYATVELKENNETKGFITEKCFFVKSRFWAVGEKEFTEHTIIVPYTDYEKYKETGSCEPNFVTYNVPKIFQAYEKAQKYTFLQNVKLKGFGFTSLETSLQNYEDYVNEQVQLYLEEEKTLKKTPKNII